MELLQVLSVSADIVSLVGFPMGLWTLWRAKRAAELANELAYQAIERLDRVALSRELELAASRILELESACESQRMPVAFDRCQQLVVTLGKLLGNHGLDEGDQRVIRTGHDDLNLITEDVKRAGRGGERFDLDDAPALRLRRFAAALSEMAARKGRAMMEVPNAK